MRHLFPHICWYGNVLTYANPKIQIAFTEVQAEKQEFDTWGGCVTPETLPAPLEYETTDLLKSALSS